MNGPHPTVGSTSGDADRAAHATRRPLLWEAAPAIDIVRPEEAAELRDLLFNQPNARAALAEIAPSTGLAASEAQRLRFAVAALGALRSCGNKLGSETRDNDCRARPQLPEPLPFAALDDASGKRFRQVAWDAWMEWPEESGDAWRPFRRQQLEIAKWAVPLRDRMAPGVGLDIAGRVWAFRDGAWRPVNAALCFEAQQRKLATVVALAVVGNDLEFTLQRVLMVALRADGRLRDSEWDTLRHWAADVLRANRLLDG